MTSLTTQAGKQSDADLLALFVNSHDERAFAAIVNRHGAMVLSVCKRVLQDVHDAEDVCQAVFLVLARRAKFIRIPESLSSWLHGVAARLAHKLRCKQARHLHRSRQLTTPSQLVSSTTHQNAFLVALDEELARLAEPFRSPLILCYLQGRTRDEAAEQLGWTPTVLRGRLDRGRLLLKKRLQARGITFSAALLASVLTQTKVMSAVLTVRSIKAAMYAYHQLPLHPSVASLVSMGIGLTVPGLSIMPWLIVLALAVVSMFGVATYSSHAPVAPAANASLIQVTKNPLPEYAVARLGSLRFRHGHWVNGMKIIPTTTMMASIANRTLYFWNLPDGMNIRQLEYDHTLEHLSVSVNGKYTAFCTSDDTVHVVESQTGQELWHTSLAEFAPADSESFRKMSSSVHRLDIDSSGALHVYGPDQRLRTWDVAGKKLVRTIELDTLSVSQLQWSQDGKRCFLISKTSPETLQVWSWPEWKLLKAIAAPEAIRRFTLSDDAKRVLLVPNASQSEIQLWNTATGLILHTLATQAGEHTCASFSPDGLKLATGSNGGTLQLRNCSTASLEFQSNTDCQFHQLLFSEDGKRLYFFAPEGFIRECDAETGKLLHQDDFPKAANATLSSSPHWLLTLGKQQAYLWNKHTNKLTRSIKGNSYFADGIIVPGRDWLAMAQQDGELRIEEIASGKAIFSNKLASHLEKLIVSPDGNTLVLWPGMSDQAKLKKLLVFDLKELKLVKELDIPPDNEEQPKVIPSLNQLRYSSDGKRLWACSGTHCHLLSWDMTSLKTNPLSCYHNGGVNSLALHEASNTLFSLGYDHCVYQWDITTGNQRSKFEVGHHSCLSVSPDGQFIALANNGLSSVFEGDSTVRQKDNLKEISILSSSTGKLITNFKGHTGGVWSLGFSEDGKHLYSLGLDTTIVIWDVSRWNK
ncbi:MAG: sigma-70 family RNA polymerase sigma factor [Gemmatales bacterium]